MLSMKEKIQIDERLQRHPDRQSACVEALQIVQESQGWVSDESIQDLAEQLGMTSEELDSIATFYNFIFRKSVGRHVITVCESLGCWMQGAEGVREYLERSLSVRPGETTADGRFSLLVVPCLGACVRAPVMMVDDDLFGDLDPEKIESILEDYT